MPQKRRLLASVMLVVFLTGCSSYRSASLPRTAADHDAAVAGETVQPGAKVKICLVGDEVVIGTATEVTADSVSVWLGEDGSWADLRSIARDEIDSIEVRKTGPKNWWGPLAILGIGVLVTVIVFMNSDLGEMTVDEPASP